MAVALVSTFDFGLQPVALASAAAYLKHAGMACTVFDFSQDEPSAERLVPFDFVVFHVPGFEGLAGTTALARALRERSSAPSIGFVGTYAAINASTLLQKYADWVILGSFEESLVTLCQRIRSGESVSAIPGLLMQPGEVSPVRALSDWLLPDRTAVPSLVTYEYPAANRFLERRVVAANVETTRGCRFECAYCSIFAATQAKIGVVPVSTVLADIAQVERAGAEHICFSDAEFLNAPKHALAIVQEMHDRFPKLTFDFTSRIDLIGADLNRLQEFVRCGARWVTSAFEFPKRQVLEIFNKGFGPKQLDATLSMTRQTGLHVNPTFVLFNPWVSVNDIEGALRFIEERELDVEDVQFTTRLWLYKGSPLLENWDVQASIVREHEFHYEWRHRDGRVEELFSSMEARYGSAAGRCCLKC
jgi:radical SAM superfamily enzyme YgiQ (UPF0313 family)